MLLIDILKYITVIGIHIIAKKVIFTIVVDRFKLESNKRNPAELVFLLDFKLHFGRGGNELEEN